jgi:ABC-type sugar transport system ATPase subunit
MVAYTGLVKIRGLLRTHRHDMLAARVEMTAGRRIERRRWFALRQLPIDARLRDIIRSRTDSEALILGIRPEDLTLTTQPTEGAIEAEVYVVEPLGDRTIYDLRVGDDIVKVRTPPTFDAAPGSRLWFNADRSRIHLFDPRTDLAIM